MLDNTLPESFSSVDTMPIPINEHPLVQTQSGGGLFTITFNNPEMRNALSTLMFDHLEDAVARATDSTQRGESIVVLLRSCGSAFCAGFDLAECVHDHGKLEQFVRRLGAINTSLRAMPAVVIAQVQGPALAGGCAIVAACDIVYACDFASFGYPVHRIGISPAVSLPTLMATAGFGGARQLALSGEIVNAQRAQALGLVYSVTRDESALTAEVTQRISGLVAKGPQALRVTKKWLNHIDGSDPDGFLGRRAQETIDATAQLCSGIEATTMLHDFWSKRKSGS